jgi:predicted nucleic acid-binding protein
MKALLDTNILIDYLNGVEAARKEIQRYKNPMISPITWMEVMVGALESEQETVRSFLAHFEQIHIDSQVAEIAVSIRHSCGMRLPDAIIWASAQKLNALLISRNTKDFPADAPGIRVPYQL